MLAIKIRRAARSRRGQTMVLGALGVLLVSIMMMLTLNVGQAVHEKIRIQQLADASAFSMAVQEARVYNFMAYTNRANIGSLVSAASLHSFMSMASAIPEMFEAASYTFFMHAGIEFAMCFTCCWPFCFAMCQHCYHGIRNIQAAMNYLDSADELRDAVNDIDDQFKYTMLALDAHMLYISGAQKALGAEVYAQLFNDDITKSLRDRIAPQASNNESLLCIKNAGTLGMVPAILQGGSRGFADVFERDEETQKYVPTMIANGTRWSEFSLNDWFVSDRGLMESLLFMHPDALQKLAQDDGDPADGISLPIIHHEGQGRIIKDPDGPESRIKGDSMGPDGDSVAAYDSGWILSIGMICIFSMIPPVWPWKSVWVGSGPDGGDHEDPSSCSGADDHKFRCLDLSFGPFACFTVFDAEPDPKKNFGQPVAYSVIHQKLNLMSGGGRGAWEVDLQTDGNGSINVDLKTSDGPIEVNIANNEAAFAEVDSSLGQGVAMSKAMAYYHFPRYRGNDGSEGWKEHPNLFNPYWKAKLHPFRRINLDNLNPSAAEPVVVLGLGGAAQFIRALPGAPLP